MSSKNKLEAYNWFQFESNRKYLFGVVKSKHRTESTKTLKWRQKFPPKRGNGLLALTTVTTNMTRIFCYRHGDRLLLRHSAACTEREKEDKKSARDERKQRILVSKLCKVIEHANVNIHPWPCVQSKEQSTHYAFSLSLF
jgi:hypothetical protein